MKMKILPLVLLLAMQQIMYACGGINQRVYAGDIKYALDAANPLNCTVTITLDFDIPDNLSTDSIFVDWGDGKFSTVFANSITADSAHHLPTGAVALFQHVYIGNHIYDSVPASGYYNIAPITQYRLTYASNIAAGQPVDLRFYVQAKVFISTANGFINHSPVMPPAVPGFALTHTAYSEATSFTNADGDSIVFDLLSPIVNDNIPVPSYLFPNQICENIGQSSALSIDHASGEITWSAPCLQGVFAVTRVVSKYRNGQLLGTIMADQNIFVSTATGIVNETEEPVLRLAPNPAHSVINLELAQPANITIYNVLGEPVLKRNVSANAEVDISALSNGVYWLCQNHTVTKFVKQ